MHDVRTIRSDPHGFDAGLKRRGLAAAAARLLAQDEEARAAIHTAETAQADANAAAKAIGAAMQRGDTDSATQLKLHVATLKHDLPALEEKARSLSIALRGALAVFPNLPAADVPDGADETHNVEQSRHGTPRVFAFTPLEHDRMPASLGLDLETAASVSGARFAYLRGGLARLNRAIGQYMLDLHTQEFGYQEVNPPLLVRDEAAFGTGQLPKFAEDLFQTTDGRWLIPTAEVSLTNIVRESIMAQDALPLRFTALTPCFRSEAGSAGRDTRGLIRQHQFEKVELVSITAPEASADEHERMTHAAETVLQRLELPYRRMLLCSGDMGPSAAKTYDLEVWLPGQNAYREISSCSNCTDYQARRMNARYRPAKGSGEEKSTRFVHTLNGSALAVGRCLVAIMENYQQDDGSIAIPHVLLPYMGGVMKVSP